MNVNKKFDRLKQWTNERMGGEVKTNASDDFKALEAETTSRQDGIDKMHRHTANYIKAVSKRAEGDNKEKLLPIAQLGGAMVQHGDEFEHDSQYGQCLTAFGRTQERLARSQESYISAATNTWLEPLERGLIQTKEYQAARKKLETRRLAYDASLAKMQKAKREDFRVEEELRSQKTKYEEAEEDVYRRMIDLKDSEGESVTDLTAFLDAQLAYHDKCREALLQLRDEWPASQHQTQGRNTRPAIRSRSSTSKSQAGGQIIDERPPPELRTNIRPTRGPSGGYSASPVEYEDRRPGFARSTTYDTASRSRRDLSPAFPERLARVPSDSLMLQRMRSNLKNPGCNTSDTDVFGDDSTNYTNDSDRSYGDTSFSPTTSHGSGSATPSTMTKKKAPPPPPPPSRATKPPPPPPPMKRSLLV